MRSTWNHRCFTNYSLLHSRGCLCKPRSPIKGDSSGATLLILGIHARTCMSKSILKWVVYVQAWSVCRSKPRRRQTACRKFRELPYKFLVVFYGLVHSTRFDEMTMMRMLCWEASCVKPWSLLHLGQSKFEGKQIYSNDMRMHTHPWSTNIVWFNGQNDIIGRESCIAPTTIFSIIFDQFWIWFLVWDTMIH